MSRPDHVILFVLSVIMLFSVLALSMRWHDDDNSAGRAYAAQTLSSGKEPSAQFSESAKKSIPATQDVPPTFASRPADAPECQPSLINLKFKESVDVSSPNEAAALVHRLKGQHSISSPIERADKLFAGPPGPAAEAKRKIGLERWVTLTIPSSLDSKAEAARWARLPGVEVAECQAVYTPDLLPNDARFGEQWHHYNTGQLVVPYYGTPDADLDSTDAWDLTLGTILIGNPDSDVEWYHPDLVANIWRNLGEDADSDGDVLAWDTDTARYVFDPGDLNNRDDDGNGYIDDLIGWDFGSDDNDPHPESPASHGTMTSGAAIATGNNNRGVIGSCPGCRLIATRGAGESALVYAVDQGAKVITMSTTSGSLSQAMRDALAYAESRGAVTLHSAGNDGVEDPRPECDLEHVLCVTMTKNDDSFNIFTSYGKESDIAAPGFSILTTTTTGGYSAPTGTSFSTPLAAGVAGLVLSLNPDLSPEEVRSILQSSVDPIARPTRYGGTGRLNAHSAALSTLSSLQYGSFPVATLDALRTRQSGTHYNVFGTAGSPAFLEHRFYLGSGLYPTQWTPIASSFTPVENGLLGSIDLLPLIEGTPYTLKLEVEDQHGQTAMDTFYPLTRLPTPVPPALTNPIDGTPTAPAIGNLISDLLLEVVVGSSNGKVHAWDANGYALSGWPILTNNVRLTAPALADLDSDGYLDVVIGSADGNVYAFKGDGTSMPGWPQTLGSTNILSAPPALGDINLDGSIEIVAAASRESFVFSPGGALLSSWPNPNPDAMAPSIVVLADLTRDGDLEIIVPGTDNNWRPIVTVYDSDGNTLPGWPSAPLTLPLSGPIYDLAIGDVTNDDRLDVIAVSGWNVYAFNSSGEVLAGWPKATNGQVSSPALGDLDQDGAVDIAYASYDMKIYALRGNASSIQGWPVQTASGKQDVGLTAPSLTDPLNVFVASADNKIYGYTATGTPLAGWPSNPMDGRPLEFAFGDLDRDGSVEIVASSTDRRLYLFRTQQPSQPFVGWPESLYNPENTGTYPRCADGTNAGTCGLQQPKFCAPTVKLINNCQRCGCPPDTFCDSRGSCASLNGLRFPRQAAAQPYLTTERGFPSIPSAFNFRCTVS